MGAWKDWEQGMIEDGFSRREITDAASRIKGTLTDPLIQRQNDAKHLVLVITHDGTTVCEQRIVTQAQLDTLLARYMPPAARGSVAQIIQPDLPPRHPKRVVTIATSIHSTGGPRWGLL